MFILFVNLLEQRTPRRISAKPVGLSSKNKKIYLLTFRTYNAMLEMYVGVTNEQFSHT